MLSGALLMPFAAHAVTIPPNDGFVTDAADALTPEEEAALESDLSAYRTATSNEIAIVILQTLEGTPIEDAGLEIGRKWGVGSEKNNGILLTVALDERAVRFDVGYGLEGAVPDIVAKGIIDEDIFPAFRDGAYGEGIVAAVDSLKKHIGGEYTAERYEASGAPVFSIYLLFLGFIFLQWLFAVMGRTKSWWLGGVVGGVGGIVLAALFAWWISIPILVALGLLLDFIISKNFHKRGRTSWWAGGGWGPGGGRFGGGSGGGFGGFGGGSFGGGGASGRW